MTQKITIEQMIEWLEEQVKSEYWMSEAYAYLKAILSHLRAAQQNHFVDATKMVQLINVQLLKDAKRLVYHDRADATREGLEGCIELQDLEETIANVETGQCFCLACDPKEGEIGRSCTKKGDA